MTTSVCAERVGEDRARDYVLGELADPARLAFEDHLAGCRSCAAAVTRLEQGLGRLERIAAQAADEPVGPWQVLARTVLRPVAALAYLVALLLSYPVYRLLAPAPTTDAPPLVRTLTAVELFGEIAFRGESESPAGQATEPVAIEAPQDPGADLLLRAHLDLDEEDLADAGASLEIQLLDTEADKAGEAVTWSEKRRASDLASDRVLSVLLAPGKLRARETYALVVTLDRSGAPGRAEIVFRRSFYLQSPAETNPAQR